MQSNFRATGKQPGHGVDCFLCASPRRGQDEFGAMCSSKRQQLKDAGSIHRLVAVLNDYSGSVPIDRVYDG